MHLEGRASNGSQSPSHSLSATSTNGSNGHVSGLAKATNGHAPVKPETNGSHKVSNGVDTLKKMQPYWFGHNREEVSRLLMQALNEMGYSQAATALKKESGYELESPTVSALRVAVLDGRWTDVELLLFGETVLDGDSSNERAERITALHKKTPSWQGTELTLIDDRMKREMLFSIRQQKYLELLEKDDRASALSVLRRQLSPHHANTERLHMLGALVFPIVSTLAS